MEKLDQISNAIRFLSIDAVQNANSGHPGMPMGMSDIATVLWSNHVSHNPNNPLWFNRDRFVLSNGHGSMLLYSVLHLTGYKLTLDEIKNFRQLHSKTPGHPEYDIDLGIETTTGPLGQGLSNAVGMALAEKHLSARFNKKDLNIVDHYTYAFLGDGCLMEGISHEACSFAGTHKLNKLICFYDQNGISIDGKIDNWFTDDTAKRFEAYDWHVLEIDGHDFQQINNAIELAKSETSRPTIICCKTKIGFGSPAKEGTSNVHGSPLGDEEILSTRKNLKWEFNKFEVPSSVYKDFDFKVQGQILEDNWQIIVDEYSAKHPDLYKDFKRQVTGQLPKDYERKFTEFLDNISVDDEKIATRKASQKCLEFLCEELPEMIGGSADLTGSNNTMSRSNTEFLPSNPEGTHIYYGVREFGMTGITNGMLLHGGIKPYSGTFLVFMDYARNAVRLAALMKIPNIFVYTHDSIGLGEDGPTHQPVEHLVTLRATPNLNNWRPADLTETAIAWDSAIKSKRTPTSLVLSRQGLPPIKRTKDQIEAICKGGYLIQSNDNAKLNLIASGSELNLIIDAEQELRELGFFANIISMPCLDVFKQQGEEYMNSIINQNIPSIFVEALHPDSWASLAKPNDAVIGISSFGESAPGNTLMEHFGFSVSNIIEMARKLI